MDFIIEVLFPMLPRIIIFSGLAFYFYKNRDELKKHLVNAVFYIGIYYLLTALNVIPPVLSNIKPLPSLQYSPYSEVQP
jgi:predicted transporter